jgi:predicted PurR-regulated permease PerM
MTIIVVVVIIIIIIIIIIISSTMDELKQYAKTQEKLHYLTESVKIFSNNIKMISGVDMCHCKY